MTTIQSPATTHDNRVPRKVFISALTVPVLVLGQFAMLAVIPVAIIVVTVLPTRAPSLAKDISPTFTVLLVTAACGLLVSAFRRHRR